MRWNWFVWQFWETKRQADRGGEGGWERWGNWSEIESGNKHYLIGLSCSDDTLTEQTEPTTSTLFKYKFVDSMFIFISNENTIRQFIGF